MSTPPRTARLGSSGRVVQFPSTPKYRNKKCEADGFSFDSKKERDRYLQLKLRERAGAVRGIQLQVEYRLEVLGVLICKYRADFTYEELESPNWIAVVEDVKGFKTPTYKLKKKLMKACHGIVIRET